jgi:threonine/homoserine/homoserine lactone efflux protein
MTATNPMTLAFWFVVLPGVVGEGAVRGELAWVCAGVGAGAVTWVAAFAGTLSLLGRWKRGAWVVAADLAGGVILLGFAAVAAWRVAAGV